MMLNPAEITFHGLDHSDALEADIRERVTWLEQYYRDILGCRVVVELQHRHQQDARPFHVRIEVDVPGGGPIVATHEPSLEPPLKDIGEVARLAVHHAFNVARRRLQDFAREQRGVVKTHETPADDQVKERIDKESQTRGRANVT